jgi:hypothetical protein
MSLEDGSKRTRLTFLLAFAAVIFASDQTNGKVIVSCNDIGGGIVEVRYDVFGESSLVRAFALDITVSIGATIENVFDYKVGESTSADPGYGIFPGSMVFGDNGEVIDWGTPVAPAEDLGALPGLGSYGITIEMGSLYYGTENAPLVSDTLLRFAIDLHEASRINVELSLNDIRGGIVMEDSFSASDVDLIGCELVPEPGTISLLCLGAAIIRKKAIRLRCATP